MTGRERGFALLLVLWTMALLALLAARVLAAGQGAVRIAANLRAAAAVEAAAEGALAVAAFHLAAPGAAHWRADGSVRRLRIGATRVEFRLSRPPGLVDPDRAPPAALAAALASAGASPRRALALAAAVRAWQIPGGAAAYRAAGLAYAPAGLPFAHPSDLRFVLGMTPGLFVRLRPLLRLGPSRAVRVALTLTGPAGAHGAWRATILPGAPLRILTWRRAAW